MKWFDFTFDTPAENLACDEALLDLCERDGVEVLRFWEAREPFVVVGYGNRIESEVNVEECRRRGVPILRRCSGGGTVVQGPGCLNYNLTLRIPESGPLMSVTGTNEFVMERHRGAIEKILAAKVAVQGHTDLAFAAPDQRWFKFSGNAQRRRRCALVFHGTLLHSFDLALIDALLRFPSAQPDYRANRSHPEFVRNISADGRTIRAQLRRVWNTDEALDAPPHEIIARLVNEHYMNDQWTWRR